MFEISDFNQRVCAQLSKASRAVLPTSSTLHGQRSCELSAMFLAGFEREAPRAFNFLSFFAHCTCIIIYIKSVFSPFLTYFQRKFSYLNYIFIFCIQSSHRLTQVKTPVVIFLKILYLYSAA